jgi:predicted transcriptional regulator of viral defense system
MEFERLLELVSDEPVFETALLLAGKVDPHIVRLQLTRWTKSGRVYQLRRGLYALAPPYQKVKPHPFLIANHMRRASYVSLQSALAFYGLIPETMQVTLSVTTGRPEQYETPLGVFEFRHVKPELLHGYRMTSLGEATIMRSGQQALIATPEKALLDLVYFHPGGEAPEYLHELRLQNLERLDIDALQCQAESFATPKLHRAVTAITRLMLNGTREYVTV